MRDFIQLKQVRAMLNPRLTTNRIKRKPLASKASTLSKLTLAGETLQIREWLSIYEVSQPTYWRRIDSGWPIDMAITTPTLKRGRKCCA